MKVWLDDLRAAPAGWYRTLSVRQTIDTLRTGQVRELSLDFDLDGSDPGHKGDEVLDWLKHALRRREIPAPVIHLHTANPYGAALMTWKLQRLEARYGMQPMAPAQHPVSVAGRAMAPLPNPATWDPYVPPCPPGQRARRASTPPFDWECVPFYLGACPPREVSPDDLIEYRPQAYEAGCRVFDASCRVPPGWMVATHAIPGPPVAPGEGASTPTRFVACPPGCFVYEDALPTADDPDTYCCPGRPGCPPDSTACGGRPCPPGSISTYLHPEGWSTPEFGWWDSYQICCTPEFGIQAPPTKPPEAPRPSPGLRTAVKRRPPRRRAALSAVRRR